MSRHRRNFALICLILGSSPIDGSATAASLNSHLGVGVTGPTASDALPVYPIDLRFLHDHSILKTVSEVEAGNFNQSRSAADMANQNNISFAEPAILDFGTRQVKVHLIGSRHDGSWDTHVMTEYLTAQKISPHDHHLFIEEGDETQSDSVTQLKSILNTTPNLVVFLDQLLQRPFSPFRGANGGGNPFSELADEWTLRGGQWTNMDLADNYETGALTLLRKSLTYADANYFLLYRFQNLLQEPDMALFGNILAQLNPPLPGGSAPLLSLRDIHFDVRRQIFDLARERCMRMTLYKNVKDGDVVVTHPQHLRAILRPEVRPGLMR